MTVFVQWQSWINFNRDHKAPKPKIFTIWFFIEKVYGALSKMVNDKYVALTNFSLSNCQIIVLDC
jgi:GTP-dependent phosphoenolpyruvate carboxykinase